MRPRVYVSGPYSLPVGGEEQNVRLAVGAGELLLSAGFAPLVPHLSHHWHLRFAHDWDTWLEVDEAWVAVSDAVLRLPGESLGADRECALARSLGVPVFDDLDALLASAELSGAFFGIRPAFTEALPA